MEKELQQYSNRASLTFTAIISILHIVLLQVAFRFETIYAEFGAQLPALTKLFLPESLLYYLLPAIAILAYAARYFELAPTRLVFKTLGIASLVELPVFIAAMYLPVIQLGAVVTQS